MKRQIKQNCILRNIFILLIAFGLILPKCTICYAAEPITVFVATNGSDDGAGTIDDPLKTLVAARDKVRQIRIIK